MEHEELYVIIKQTVLRQVHSFLHIELWTKRELALPLSIYSIFSLQGHPVAAYIVFYVFYSLPTFLQYYHSLKGSN